MREPNVNLALLEANSRYGLLNYSSVINVHIMLSKPRIENEFVFSSHLTNHKLIFQRNISRYVFGKCREGRLPTDY